MAKLVLKQNVKAHWPLGMFSDSKSALQALQSKGWTNPLILQLLEQHHFLSTVLAKTINFCWIPSYVGIKGSDLVDQAAKDAPNDHPSSLPVPYTDRRRHITCIM